MRVAIVTGTQPHQKNLCAKIAGRFDVVGVIHPAEAAAGSIITLRRLLSQVKSHGWPMMLMCLAGKAAGRVGKPGRRAGRQSVTPVDFSEGVAAYDRIPRTLIHSNCDVRQPAVPDLLRSWNPDVTLCLGGPVYPQSFIDASPIMLNFHSGISPVYCGAASIWFAFANRHPHLCGGTLMLMGIEVDGGRILGHFLPEVQSGDSPESLFSKTVRGAATMYVRILEHLRDHGGPLRCIRQPPPLFYTRSFQLGWYHREMIARHLHEDVPARFERAEAQLDYWCEATEASARNAYRSALEDLLWRDGQSK